MIGYNDTLATLREAYFIDRRVMDHLYPMIVETDVCRYCLGAWHQFANCSLAGHVRCATSMPFQRRLVEFIDSNPRLTYWTIATALGVTPSVVRAWWQNVKSPRKGPRPTESEAQEKDG